MASAQGTSGMSGTLTAKKLRTPKFHKVRQFRIPWTDIRLAYTRDQGEAGLFATSFFHTNLSAVHRDGDGAMIDQHDLGSGVITSVGALALANDGIARVANVAGWDVTNAPTSTLQLCKNHGSGTNATAAALSDIKLGTDSTSGGQNLVAGTQSFQYTTSGSLSSTNYPKLQSVATISYTNTETVTEWGLFGDLGAIGGTALSASTGTPFTAGSNTSGTLTSTVTASSTTVRGQSQTVLHNTGNATPSWGLVISNSTTVANVLGVSGGGTSAWYKVSDSSAGANPANGNAFVWRPIMLDHKVFTGIGVNNGDSIQFTYQLSVQDGT